MTEKRTFLPIFARISSRGEALKVIRDASFGFFLVAAIQGGIGIFMAPAMLIDATLFAVLGWVLLRWKSRIAAVFLFVLSGMAFVVTILNRMGIMAEGGANIILATIVLWVSARAVEAAFKLQGRFKETSAIERMQGERQN